MANPSKQALRDQLTIRLREISEARKEIAHDSLITTLFPLLEQYSHILSFSSFRGEIDTHPLNRWLCQKGKLLLPVITKDSLSICSVPDLSYLLINRFGILEPCLKQCPLIPIQQISVALIPGLSFDQNNFRLGYGKGFYDRLLSSAPDLQTLGIGYLEQLIDHLPIEPHDRPVSSCFLF